MKEIWKKIQENPRYEVSNEGRIRRKYDSVGSIKKNNSQYKYLKCHNHKGHGTDYFSVSLCDREGNIKRKLVHKLVATEFIPNPHNYPQINHKNGNGHDNRVENLEWCSEKQNMVHARENHLLNPGYKPKKIYCVEYQKTFSSSFEAADFVNEIQGRTDRRTKNVASVIRLATCGKRKKAYGLTWKYYN